MAQYNNIHTRKYAQQIADYLDGKSWVKKEELTRFLKSGCMASMSDSTIQRRIREAVNWSHSTANCNYTIVSSDKGYKLAFTLNDFVDELNRRQKLANEYSENASMLAEKMYSFQRHQEAKV